MSRPQAAFPEAARDRIAARARRIARIRRSIIAGTLAAFALAWGVIAFDGSMGSSMASTASSGSDSGSASASASTSTISPSAQDSGSDDSAATAQDGPVVTSQS
jgi:hypothetical protein